MPGLADIIFGSKPKLLPVPLDVSRFDWGKRMFDINAPFIQNPDGSRSTHRMAAEVDDKGNWFAFPTIVQLPDGKLHKFEDNFEAMNYNRQRGEAVNFGQDKDSALQFAEGGYKIGTPLQQTSAADLLMQKQQLKVK